MFKFNKEPIVQTIPAPQPQPEYQTNVFQMPRTTKAVHSPELQMLKTELEFQKDWLMYIVQTEKQSDTKRSQDLSKRCEERYNEIVKTLAQIK